MMTYAYILLAIFILIQAFDFYSTKRVIERGGKEKTKLIITLMEKFGLVPGLLIAKIGVCIFVALGTFSSATYIHVYLTIAFLLFLNIWYIFKVVLNNWKIYNSKRS